MSRKLHIVRHADVVIDPKVRAADWSLSPDAEANVLSLVSRFNPSHLRRVITSDEKKAQQTGRILATALGLPMETRQGLEEHHRRRDDFLDAASFRAIVEDFFARPKERVFGMETAETSLKRFDATVREIMDETDDHELIVSHGRVISLFLASRRKADPMKIWASLELPDHRAIAWSRRSWPTKSPRSHAQLIPNRLGIDRFGCFDSSSHLKFLLGVNTWLTHVVYHGIQVHAILGIRASPSLFCGFGRIPRIAWTKERLSGARLTPI